MGINDKIKGILESKSGGDTKIPDESTIMNEEGDVHFETIEEIQAAGNEDGKEKVLDEEKSVTEEGLAEAEKPAEEERSTEERKSADAEKSMEEKKPADAEKSTKEKKPAKPVRKMKQAEKVAVDEEKVKKRRRRRRHRRREKDMARIKKSRKIVAIMIGTLVGLLVAAYAGFAFFFTTHFLFNTNLNGIDVSLKNAEEVKSYMEERVDNYQLVIVEAQDKEEVIQGSDIDIDYVPGKEIELILSKQDKPGWIKSLWEDANIETKIGVSYDNNKLEEQIASLKCLIPDEQIVSENAYPQFRGGAFIIVPEKVGTQIDVEKFGGEIRKAIDGFQDEMSILDTGCYLLPEYTRKSSEVTAAKDEMNSYLGAEITYDFNPFTEVVGADQIAEWVTIDENMKVTFNEGAVRGYVASLATKYDTLGKPRQFTTASGNVVTVEGGDYGWEIDQNAEYSTLTANISGKEVVTREPHYLSRAASHDVMDMGNTYAEVDLTAQYMYFFQDGAVALECPVVTGNPNAGNGTPQGAYWLTYKQSPSVLRAPLRPDGTREYETPVSFWMPFNGGIGFHDATWQPSFGGDRYLYAGSHGCVNMSYDTAARLYELIPENCPVICHY